MNDRLISFRKELHQYPELSGHEEQTARRVIEFVREFNPSDIISNIGGHGVAVVYGFGTDGPTVLIRCELDALPITEINNFSHRSKHTDISHKCGHDGHMAIVAGLSGWLADAQFTKGKVVLLFQPAEETGKGAAQVLEDSRFPDLAPDYIFALHNLPGEPLHTVVIKPDYFTATVQSLRIRLKGRKSHASEPENGDNPTLAAAKLIQLFSTFVCPNVESAQFALLTPICTAIGEKNYGIAPDKAELHYTIRTWGEDKMKDLESGIKAAVTAIASEHRLKYTLDWFEFFPATKNDSIGTSLVEKIALQQGVEVKHRTTPLRFGEDFGWFSQKYKSVLFGIGTGEGHPSLHHSDYDFPDVLLETGSTMFKGLIEDILRA